MVAAILAVTMTVFEPAGQAMRLKAVEIARGWLGTPYLHQASLRGKGCDCLGLLRGVYAELYDRPAPKPPAYSPLWAEAQGRETLFEAAQQYMTQIALDEALPGDVLLFRMRQRSPAKHCAIMSAGTIRHGEMIHAYHGKCVLESAVMRGAAYAFRWREIR
ncbi:MAG: NlpC/P60 family protein [Neomegalonema sp.]|nr:NlpC/P60 family protein [Neomegalonema sp.]